MYTTFCRTLLIYFLLINHLLSNRVETDKLLKRLPLTIIPTHYNLTIRPFIDKFIFHGNVTIHIQIKEASDIITLYAAELSVDKAKLTSNKKEQLQGKVDLNKDTELLTVTFDKQLQIGEYELYLEFRGDINDQMHGFYRNKYTTPDGKEVRYGASTQFEPTDCRRAFPCWDEPNFKATFDITLVTPKNRLTISNMPIKSESEFVEDKEWKVTRFERTPIMSTYLVAYVVGEYEYIEAKDSNGVSIKLYTPIGKKEHGQFALETAAKVLPFYAEYFGIKYPLAKVDQIALPDFLAEGMENWGLITYDETVLLIDPKSSSLQTRQDVATVVAHELAHQWFGNLVTMDWWTDLWLNEGFASWIEYLAVDKCYPEFDIWTQFVADTFAAFLVPDALKSSHPIEEPINNPSEIIEIFDEISYSKGSSVIRMLHDYIGDDAFRKGLHNYLKEYSYKNTITVNLWSHLAKASGKPIEEVMSSWTLQMGYPLITVTEQQTNTTRTLKLKQQRFLADGTQDEKHLQWKVPITIVTKSNPNKIALEVLMDKPEITITLENIPENDWIKLNYNSIGLYRVLYESQALQRLKEAIANKTLSPGDRLMLQDDLAALCNAGHQSFVDYLELLLSYKNEDNFTVWKGIESTLDKLYSLLEYTDYPRLFESYWINLYSTIYGKLGWDAKTSEDPLSSMLRSIVIGSMGLSGDESIINEAKQRFKRHLNGELIDPNIRTSVYRIVSRYGDKNTQKELRKLYKDTDINEEKQRLLSSMGYSTDEKIIQDTLEFIFEGNNVRSQDTSYGLEGCTSNRIGRDIVWKYLQKNWNKIVKRFGETSFSLTDFVSVSLSSFADERIANEAKMFLDKCNTPVITRSVKKAIETINVRAAVLKRDSKAIEAYLKKQ